LGAGLNAGSKVSNIPKTLYKSAIDYCCAHKELVDTEDLYRQMASTGITIRYCEAHDKLAKAKAKFAKSLPDGWTPRDALGELLLIIKETYDNDNETYDT
jgi:pentatricopeptide repeat protein